MNIEILKKRREFVNISTRGEKIFTHNFIFLALKNSEITNIRLGFTASKKIGNAPERNRAKRRLRSASNLIFAKNNICNYDIVLIARKNILKSKFNIILKDLDQSLNKIKQI